MQLPIDLREKMKLLTSPWSPIDVLHVNDQVIRLALFQGEYHWHKHDNEDEVFYVCSGKIHIQIKGQEDLILSEGQFGVVPKGIEHCPKSEGPSFVLMIEPASLQSKGSA